MIPSIWKISSLLYLSDTTNSCALANTICAKNKYPIDTKTIKDFVYIAFFVLNNFNIKETAKNKNTIFAPLNNKEMQKIITRKITLLK